MEVFSKSIVLLILLQFIGGGVTESNNVFLTPGSPIYLNLTELIDTVLVSNSSIDHKNLKDVLWETPLVFYETDVSLDKLQTIIAVIDLVDRLKADGIRPQIMLSLNFVNRSSGTFLESRARDVFFSSKSQLDFEDRSKLLKYVSAIALDFNTPQEYFLRSDYVKDYSFTHSVKTFLKQLFGNAAMTVGVLHGVYIENEFMKRQLKYADFAIYCISDNRGIFSTSSYPLLPQFGSDFMYNVNYYQERVKGFIGQKTIHSSKFVHLFMKIQTTNDLSQWISNGYPYQSSDNYWSTFGRVIGATQNYTSVSNNFLRNIFARSEQAATKIVKKWASLEAQNVLFSSTYSNVHTDMKPLVRPILQTWEDSADICQLQKNLSIIQNHFDTMVVDEKSWRIITRLENSGVLNRVECEGKANNKSEADLAVTLSFKTGVSEYWKHIESTVKDLVYNESSLAEFRLNTLVFNENDIKASEGIQRFMTLAKQNRLNLGCSISFETMRAYFSEYYYGKQLTAESLKETLQTKVCQPVFSSVDLFVWKVDDANDYRYRQNGLFSAYSDMFLGREIFLAEFPDKNVSVEFTTKWDKQILSSIFDVPIISPLDQILL